MLSQQRQQGKEQPTTTRPLVGRPTMARPLQGRPTAAKAPSLQGQPPAGAVAYSVAPTRNGSRLWAQFLWVSLTD
ncbi:hypothetical protein BHE74_00029483 [Ensete ventricosum]|nr:hypothetical protein BHE74_00029483 [Ensete ventricosum]